jgi:hypothetical protein
LIVVVLMVIFALAFMHALNKAHRLGQVTQSWF